MGSQDIKEVVELGRCDDAVYRQGGSMEQLMRAGDRCVNGSGGSGAE